MITTRYLFSFNAKCLQFTYNRRLLLPTLDLFRSLAPADLPQVQASPEVACFALLPKKRHFSSFLCSTIESPFLTSLLLGICPLSERNSQQQGITYITLFRFMGVLFSSLEDNFH
jgi:hypothetical protein